MGHVALSVHHYIRAHPLTRSLLGLFSIIAGTVAFVAQLVIYVCATQQMSIKVVAVLLATFTLLPLLHFLPVDWSTLR